MHISPKGSFRDLASMIKLGPFPSYLAGASLTSTCRPGTRAREPSHAVMGQQHFTLEPSWSALRFAGEERRACSFLPCRWFWIAGVKQKTENILKELQKHFRGEWLASIQDLTMVAHAPPNAGRLDGKRGREEGQAQGRPPLRGRVPEVPGLVNSVLEGKAHCPSCPGVD